MNLKTQFKKKGPKRQKHVFKLILFFARPILVIGGCNFKKGIRIKEKTRRNDNCVIFKG